MTVTSGKLWRQAREEGIEIPFPSGNRAMIRPLDVDFFLRTATVPEFLAGTINRLINGDVVTLPEPEQCEKNRTEWLPFINEMTKLCFVNPRVVDNPTADDEISVDDVSYADKLALYRFFLRPVNVLRSFRRQTEESLAALDVAQNNGDTPLPTAPGTNVGLGNAGNA